MFRCVIAALLATAGLAGSAQAVSITTSYTQNFNTLAATGSSSILPAGWTFTESGSNANATYTAGTGSDNAGNTYSFGAANSTDRAFGTLLSGTLIPTLFAQFENGNGTAITDLTVSYFGEMWRLGTVNRVDRLDFAYSINGAAFVNFDALDFSSPVTTGVGAKNGNADANRTAISATLAGINLDVGGTIIFRWNDFNASGSDDGLAIDDFMLAATTAPVAAVPEPATWGMMILGFGMIGGALRRRAAIRIAA